MFIRDSKHTSSQCMTVAFQALLAEWAAVNSRALVCRHGRNGEIGVFSSQKCFQPLDSCYHFFFFFLKRLCSRIAGQRHPISLWKFKTKSREMTRWHLWDISWKYGTLLSSVFPHPLDTNVVVFCVQRQRILSECLSSSGFIKIFWPQQIHINATFQNSHNSDTKLIGAINFWLKKQIL